MKELLPDAARFEPVKTDLPCFKAYDKNNQLLGACFLAQAKGYSSTIETLVGMYSDGTIAAIKVISQNETSGLGARVTEPAFASQFVNKKNIEGVQAITGATISSCAVVAAVKNKTAQIRNLLQP